MSCTIIDAASAVEYICQYKKMIYFVHNGNNYYLDPWLSGAGFNLYKLIRNNPRTWASQIGEAKYNSNAVDIVKDFLYKDNAAN